MYYKVLKDNKVIDVLDKLIYLKWLKNRKRMVLCNIEEAQAILSSDGNTIWHVKGLYEIPVGGYETVSLEPINEFEYKQLRIFNMRTPESLIDEYNLLLIEMGVI